MRIGIVEDTFEDRQHLRRLVELFFQSQEMSAVVVEYDKGQSFLDDFRFGAFDILFLDIYLGDMIGIHIAEEVRKSDTRCKIIFTTQTDDFAVEGYAVRASYYLLKPVTEASLASGLALCLDDEMRESRFVEVTSNRRQVRIRLRDISHVTLSRNTLLLYTQEGTEKVYSSFGDFAPQLLSDGRFLQCYHGCIINMDYVAQLEENCFVMANGERIQMRKRGAPAIKSAYYDYLYQQCRK